VFDVDVDVLIGLKVVIIGDASVTAQTPVTGRVDCGEEPDE